jgi:hypothetical protein
MKNNLLSVSIIIQLGMKKNSLKSAMNNNNKTLWIINEYAGSPYYGMEFRHYYTEKIYKK